MTGYAIARTIVYVLTVVLLALPLGRAMARLYEGKVGWLGHTVGRIERAIYRLAGVRESYEMSWKRYALALLVFNFLGALAVYGLQRFQGLLPLNPQHLGPVRPEVALNTAVSFATNTNWQAYAGETTLSHLTQMAALTVQNFVSAATGIAVLVALVRGIVRTGSEGIGNFWVDMTRSVLYLLLPLSFVVALILVSQGVVQTFDGATIVDPWVNMSGGTGAGHQQTIALGPVASQVAIKQLGTNGGGFFASNSAHPFENPTPLSNFVEMTAILLIPTALCFTFGHMVRDRRQGWVVLAAMLVILLPLMIATIGAEQAPNPMLADLPIDQAASVLQPGGNMEGKEARFGVVDSAIWATATTAASNGSVNSMLDSFMPMGGLFPMWLIQLGEVVFGGVGSGLYGMLVYVLVAVFIAGLMVGRTPEYLGKKVESYEMKMASLVVLIPVAAILIGTAVACLVPSAVAATANPAAHGFSEILYAMSSGAGNNGSAFAGLTSSGRFWALAMSFEMLVGRYWLMIPVLAIAGSLARKKRVPATAGTLPTHTPLFAALLVGTVVLVGALTFAPALALGPIAEHLQLVHR